MSQESLPLDATAGVPDLNDASTAPLTPEARVNDLRERVLRGEKISIEEYHEVIQSLRTRRLDDSNKAAEKQAPKVAKRVAAKPNQTVDDLLKDLGL